MKLDPDLAETIRRRHGESAFGEWFGLTVGTFDVGSAELHLPLKPHHLNAGGIVHGGVIATLLDSAIGVALRTRLGSGSQHVTLHLGVSYIAMAREGTLTARGSAVHAGSRAAHGDATLHDDQGRLIATATGTFLIVPPSMLVPPATPGSDPGSNPGSISGSDRGSDPGSIPEENA